MIPSTAMAGLAGASQLERWRCKDARGVKQCEIGEVDCPRRVWWKPLAGLEVRQSEALEDESLIDAVQIMARV